MRMPFFLWDKIVSTSSLQAQTSLTVGAIAFSGHNSEGATDSFSFMRLMDIDSGTDGLRLRVVY